MFPGMLQFIQAPFITYRLRSLRYRNMLVKKQNAVKREVNQCFTSERVQRTSTEKASTPTSLQVLSAARPRIACTEAADNSSSVPDIAKKNKKNDKRIKIENRPQQKIRDLDLDS